MSYEIRGGVRAWRRWSASGAWAFGLLLAAGLAQAQPSLQISEPREPGFPLEETPSSTYAHFLASDGQQWLSVYRASFGDVVLALGRLIGSDGQAASAPFPIAYDFDPKAVVFDGTAYVVLGDRNFTPAFTRVTPSGNATGVVESFGLFSPSFQVEAVAGAEGQTLAVVCQTSGLCRSFRISELGASDGAGLPVTSINQLVYSGDRYLVLSFGPGIVFDVTMLQLDEQGHPVDGTLEALGQSADPAPSAASAATGFALARTAHPHTELLMIDDVGATTIKATYGAEGDVAMPTRLIRQGDGYLLQATYFEESAIPVQEDLFQLLDSELSPVGDPLRLPATSDSRLAAAGADTALQTWHADSVQAQLLDLSPPLSSTDPIAVSVSATGDRARFVSPAPEGWLLVYSGHYARLDEDGALVGEPTALERNVQSVTRGPGGWLVAADSCSGQNFDEDDTPCSLELGLILDSGKLAPLDPIGPMTFPEQSTTVRSTFSITGSEQGWLVVWSATDELHASRLDAEGSVVGDVVLADKERGHVPVASALVDDGYRAFWWDEATSEVWSRTLSTEGDVTASPAVVVGSHDEVRELTAAASAADFWLMGESLCLEPSCLVEGLDGAPIRTWFQAGQGEEQAVAGDSFGGLVSAGGVVLGVLNDAHQAAFSPVQLGLAQPGGRFSVVHTFEGGANPTIAAKPDGRALVAFTHVNVESGPPVPRVVTSLVQLELAGQGGGGTPDTAGQAGQGGQASSDDQGGASAGEAEGAPDRAASGGGCGCRAAPRPGSQLTLLLPLALLWRRRRQGRHSS